MFKGRAGEGLRKNKKRGGYVIKTWDGR